MMKVLFLDFDGVLNSSASVAESIKRRLLDPSIITPVNEDLCPMLCRNLQFVLSAIPDVKIVISSSWRLFFSLQELKAKLTSYGVDSAKVIDQTPLIHDSQYPRADDITAWLDAHPDVDTYAIVDDNDDMGVHRAHLVLTTYASGLGMSKAVELIRRLKGRSDCHGYRYKGAYGRIARR